MFLTKLVYFESHKDEEVFVINNRYMLVLEIEENTFSEQAKLVRASSISKYKKHLT